MSSYQQNNICVINQYIKGCFTSYDHENGQSCTQFISI